jgi:flagellar basal-body rod protein FlgC
MSLGSVFDLAGMGMTAQSLRLNTTASNLANAQAASGSAGEVYRARHPVFETVRKQLMTGAGGKRRYEPHHPKADQEGYVYYPNVNVVEEMADMISASRSFQMNVEVMNAAKTMMQKVLSLGQ